MDAWAWLTIMAVVAIVLFAVAWWSSGRAKPRGRGPENSMTQEQVDLTHMNFSQHQAGQPGGAP
jgi:hypothetical protein